MLSERYEKRRMHKALEMLLVDRPNEFRTLEESVLSGMPEPQRKDGQWREFILNFCLDLSHAFRTWNGEEPLEPNSDAKALTFLRQLGRNKKTMTELCHLLNLAYTIAEEFKVVYRRIE